MNTVSKLLATLALTLALCVGCGKSDQPAVAPTTDAAAATDTSAATDDVSVPDDATQVAG